MIESSRLILREFTDADLPALFAILSDAEAARFLPWFPAKAMEDARNFLHDRIFGQCQRGGCFYALCLREDNIPIGYISLSGGEAHELGYGLEAQFWHRGIVSEAAKAFVAQCKNNGLGYLTATHDIHNPRSGAVMESIGMEYRYSYEELCLPKNIWVTFRMYQINLGGKDWPLYRGYGDKSPGIFIEHF